MLLCKPIIDNVFRFRGWMRTTICARTTKYFCCGGTWTIKSFFDNRNDSLRVPYKYSKFISASRHPQKLFIHKTPFYWKTFSLLFGTAICGWESISERLRRRWWLHLARKNVDRSRKKAVSCSNLHNRNCRALIFCLFTDRENNRKTYSRVEINVTVKIVYNNNNKAMSIRELLIFSMRRNVLPRLCMFATNLRLWVSENRRA